MNLHSIVSGAIGAVNPFIKIKIEISTGYSISDDGERTPSYAAPVFVMAQVQALTFTDIQKIEGLNIQGERRSVYVNGRVDGLVREDSKGGDKVTLPDDTEWLVAQVIEPWPDWCKFIITRQNPQA